MPLLNNNTIENSLFVNEENCQREWKHSEQCILPVSWLVIAWIRWDFFGSPQNELKSLYEKCVHSWFRYRDSCSQHRQRQEFKVWSTVFTTTVYIQCYFEIYVCVCFVFLSLKLRSKKIEKPKKVSIELAMCQ